MTVHFVTFSSFNKLSVCRETAAHITKVCPYAKVWACFLDSDPGVSQAALSFASIRSWWTKTVKAPTSQHLRLLSLLTTSPRTYGLKKKTHESFRPSISLRRSCKNRAECASSRIPGASKLLVYLYRRAAFQARISFCFSIL